MQNRTSPYGSRTRGRTREEMATRYLTDGVHLYEIADQRTVQNFGLRRGTISYTLIREVVSEAVARMGSTGCSSHG